MKTKSFQIQKSKYNLNKEICLHEYQAIATRILKLYILNVQEM